MRHKYANPIVAQRLKRLPTIVDKLRRFEGMQLARMQDIGGIRAILPTLKDVYRLEKEYLSSKFTHELVDSDDYIKNPRDKDGYRSLHLIYRYQTSRSPGNEYNGLLVEVQIRSKLQHAWATAVETMGTLLGQALKSGQGEREWLDFFALVSSAFAHIEKTTPIPRFSHMNAEQTAKAVKKAAQELEVLEKINGYSFAMNRITESDDKNKWAYHLIVLRSLENSIELRPYGRGELVRATKDYEDIERRAEAGEKVESVLVSAGPLSELRLAYPNFFLDVSSFVREVKRIIATV